MAKYSMETPAVFTDQLNMIHFDAELYEEPAHQATNILTPGSKYVVEVSMELGAKIKCLLCGEWCVSVAAETFGPGRDRRGRLRNVQGEDAEAGKPVGQCQGDSAAPGAHVDGQRPGWV